MAYSPIEQAFINARVEEQFPTEPEQPMMLADSGQVKTDAFQNYGSIKPIPQTKFESVLEQTGMTLEQLGAKVDEFAPGSLNSLTGREIPIIGNMTIRDLLPFVGQVEDGKVTGTPAALQAAGRGEGLTRGSGWATQLTQDAKLAALDVATAGVAKPLAKGAGKAIKAVGNSIGDMSKATIKTDTKAFKSWFGTSKVVDDSGKPLVVYHGTNNDFNQFQSGFKGASENETSKIGFWFTDNPDTATSFAQRQSNDYVTKTDATGEVMKWEDGTPKKFRAPDEVGQVMPVYLSMKNPLVFESKDGKDAFEAFMDFRDKWAEYINGTKGVEGAWRKRYVAINVEKTNKEFLDYLKSNGHDGVILKNTEYDAPDGKTINQYMLTDPKAIKSAIGNSGTFDPKDPNILRGAGATGTGAAASQQDDKRVKYDATGRRVQ